MVYSGSSSWSKCSYFTELQWKSLALHWNRISEPQGALVSQKAFSIFITKHQRYDRAEKSWEQGLWCTGSHMQRHEIEIDLPQAACRRASTQTWVSCLPVPCFLHEITQFFQLDLQALFLAPWFLCPSWKPQGWASQTLCNSIPSDCNWFGIRWWCNITCTESLGEVYGHSVGKKKKKRWWGE